jgi:hypothetical protein
MIAMSEVKIVLPEANRITARLRIIIPSPPAERSHLRTPSETSFRRGIPERSALLQQQTGAMPA